MTSGIGLIKLQSQHSLYNLIYIFNSQMKELLEDPQTIPFKRGSCISLGLLKKQIDRRILKIRGMLGDKPSNITQAIKISRECQTSAMDQIEGFDESRVMNQYQQTANSGVNQKVKKMKRCSLPVNKSNHKKKASLNDPGDNNRKIRLIDYLSSQKANDNYPKADENRKASEASEVSEASEYFSDQKKFVQTSQQQRIFSSHDFEQFSEIYAQTMKISFNFDGSDEECKISDNDSSGSINGQRRLSTIGKQTHSNKKIKFTDRTAPDNDNRIAVTQECQNRMLDLVSELASKKRREGLDNKVRENLIKKIDDKFGVNDSF